MPIDFSSLDEPHEGIDFSSLDADEPGKPSPAEEARAAYEARRRRIGGVLDAAGGFVNDAVKSRAAVRRTIDPRLDQKMLVRDSRQVAPSPSTPTFDTFSPAAQVSLQPSMLDGPSFEDGALSQAQPSAADLSAPTFASEASGKGVARQVAVRDGARKGLAQVPVQGNPVRAMAEDIWFAVKAAPNAVSAAAKGLADGNDPTAVVRGNATMQRAAELDAESGKDNPEAQYAFGLSRGDIRDLPKSLAFSLLSMGAGLAVGVPTGLATAATGVGAPVAPAAGWSAGTLASGTAAYRMATAGVLWDLRKALDAASKEAGGNPITDEQFLAVAKQYEGKVKEYGYWEAVPEAVGNVVGAKVARYLFKGAAGDSLKKSILKRAGAAGAATGFELGTEATTQMGEHNVSVDIGIDPTSNRRDFTSLDDWGQSLKEVAPGVLLQQGTMHGGAHGAGLVKGKFDDVTGRSIAREIDAAAMGIDRLGSNGAYQANIDSQVRRAFSPNPGFIDPVEQQQQQPQQQPQQPQQQQQPQPQPMPELEPRMPPNAQAVAETTAPTLGRSLLDELDVTPVAPAPERRAPEVAVDDLAAAPANGEPLANALANSDETSGSPAQGGPLDAATPGAAMAPDEVLPLAHEFPGSTVDEASQAATMPGHEAEPAAAVATPSGAAVDGQAGVPAGDSGVSGGTLSAGYRRLVQARVDAWARREGVSAEDTPQLGAPDAQADATVSAISDAIGGLLGDGHRVVAFSDERRSAANGLAIGGVVAINVASNQQGVANTALHEIKHVAEQAAKAQAAQGLQDTPAQRFVAQIHGLFDAMSEAGKRAYLENYLIKGELAGLSPEAREARISEALDGELLRSEMTADFLGNRGDDRVFMKGLAKADPQGFEGFVGKWLAILDGMLGRLKGSRSRSATEARKVDGYVSDLKQAKRVAQDALVEYRRGLAGEAAAPQDAATPRAGLTGGATAQGTPAANALANPGETSSSPVQDGPQDAAAAGATALQVQNTRSRLAAAHNGVSYRGRKPEDYALLRADLERTASNPAHPNAALAREVLGLTDQALAESGRRQQAQVASPQGEEVGAAPPAPPAPERVAEASRILDAAGLRGKERIDALKDVKSGALTVQELLAAYPLKQAAPAATPGTDNAPAQRAPKPARAPRKSASRVDVEADSLLTAIAKMGGIARDSAREFGLTPEDLKTTVRVGNLRGFPFRKNGGMSISSAAEQLVELGYLHGIAEEDVRSALEEAIGEELRGAPQLSVYGKMRAAGAAHAERMDEDRDAALREAAEEGMQEDERREQAVLMAEASVTRPGLDTIDDSGLVELDVPPEFTTEASDTDWHDVLADAGLTNAEIDHATQRFEQRAADRRAETQGRNGRGTDGHAAREAPPAAGARSQAARPDGAGLDARASHPAAAEGRQEGLTQGGQDARPAEQPAKQPARQPANGIPRGLPARRTEQSDNLERFIDADLAREGQPTGFKALAIGTDQLPDALRRALAAFERATGTRVVVFRNLTPEIADFNGVTVRDGVLYVNETAQNPATATAAHEWVHNLRATHPELYQLLADEVRRQGDAQGFAKKYGYAQSQGEEELTAAAVGDAMSDPAFLQRLAERDAGLFKRVATAFREFLSSLTGKLRDQGSSAFLKEVQAFHDKLAEVLDAHAQATAQERARPGFWRAMFQLVWHGSPNLGIEQQGFKLNAIGTGEGAQVYGWGMYFAGMRKVAEWYWEKLSKPGVYFESGIEPATEYEKRVADTIRTSAELALVSARGEFARNAWLRMAEPMRDLLYGNAYAGIKPMSAEKLADTLAMQEAARRLGPPTVTNEGQLYSANIPEDDELLDWDKPLSEQPPKVREALNRAGIGIDDKALGDYDDALLGALNDGGAAPGKAPSNPTGEAIYRRISDPQAASEYLQSLGIPGLRYLDGDSRKKPLKDVKREFLAELPEDAGFDEVLDALGSGQFSPKNEAVLRALAADDWLGFDYPAQALSAALNGSIGNYDASKELIRAVADAQEDGTHNYVIWDEALLTPEKAGIQAMYSRRQATQDAYEERIDALFAGEKAGLHGVKVLDRSDVLGLLGLDDKPVLLAEGKVLAGQQNHPRMTAEVWKKVPGWIEGPAAVFDSDTDGGLVFIAPEPLNGAPVAIIVRPDAGSPNTLNAHLLLNAYDRSGTTPFQRWASDGLLRFVDTKKFPALVENTSGRRLPGTAFTSKPGMRRILTEKQLAGWRRAHNPAPSFAGRNAATADPHALASAQERLDAGEDAEAVRQATGWSRGADGKWRFEISDKDAKLTLGHKGIPLGRLIDESKYPGAVMPLGELLDHPALFAAYPALADMRVHFVKTNPDGGERGAFEPHHRRIQLSDDLAQFEALSTLLHEIQHGIQEIEGFATGGKVSNYKGNLDAQQDQYRRSAGEVEARNTQARQKLTDAERRATPPSASADVADADVIVTLNGKEAHNAPPPANAAPLQAAPRTPAADIRAAIEKAYGKLLPKLEARGLVSLAQTEAEAIEAAAKVRAAKTGEPVAEALQALRGGAELEAKHSSSGAIEGFFDPVSGQSFLVADNLTAESAGPTLMHEVGIHMAAGGKMDRLFNRAGVLLREGKGAFFDRVRQRMQEAGERGNEEAAAYLVTEYEKARAKAPATVAQFVREFIADVRAWLLNNGVVVKAEGLTVADIAAVARANARSFAREGTNAARPGGVAFSRKADPDLAQIERERAATEKAHGGRAAYDREKQAGRTKLNFGQWVAVRTPRFKAWFGDWENDPANASKVVDPQTGEPLVVYHGAPDLRFLDADGTFKSQKDRLGMGRAQAAHWFTPSMATAQSYADPRRAFDYQSAEEGVFHGFLRLANPSVIDAGGAHWRDAQRRGQTGDVIEQARADGHDGVVIRNVKDDYNNGPRTQATTTYAAFDSTQIKSATGNNGNYDTEDGRVAFSRKAEESESADPDLEQIERERATWDSPEHSELSDWVFQLQDRHIDLKEVTKRIRESGSTLTDRTDGYLREELYHGRVAARTNLFAVKELQPLFTMMRVSGVSLDELETYLHARHAPERNAQMKARNPGLRGNDALSGMSDADAAAVTAKATPAMQALAARVDAIIDGTRNLMEASGLEKAGTMAALRGAYAHYVPLHRDEVSPKGSRPAQGQGQGYSVKGSTVKRATGSNERVTSILAHLVMEREATITRAEKNLVATAIYAMATQNPNADFWQVDKAPKIKQVDDRRLILDPVSGNMLQNPNYNTVYSVVDPNYKSRDNVLVLKVNGEERVVVFNERDERAMRMVKTLKNLDMDASDALERALETVGKGTRWFAAVNTQYNPVFLLTNAIRDIQAAILNLDTTPLRGQRLKVLGNSAAALRGIWRAERDPAAQGYWEDLWREYQLRGGQTGYREAFATAADRAEALQKEIDSLDRGTASRAVHGALDLLATANDAVENAIRLSAYKAARDMGVSKDRAAALGKNLTVNFNRKGQAAKKLGPLYAFFNASMQGSARALETLAGPTGKRIIAGGIMLGVLQALMLAGMDDDDREAVQDFELEKSLVIPIPGRRGVVKIPMPLGLNVLPNIGRHLAEMALAAGKRERMEFGRHVTDLFASLFDAFNPIGGGGSALEMIAPTVLDPAVQLYTNKNFTGRPIYNERSPYDPAKPGADMRRQGTSPAWARASEAVNRVTGGDAYTRNMNLGAWASPQPEALRHLAESVGGGVWRETERVVDAVLAALDPDAAVDAARLPFASRFYGDLSNDYAPTSSYHKNLDDMAALKRRINGMTADGDETGVLRLLKDRPEANLVDDADDVRQQMSELQAARREMTVGGTPAREIKEVEHEMATLMREFNARVRAAKTPPEADATTR